MKRFITYLFHYEDGNKVKNIGFIRTDLRNDLCRMEIHIQNLGRFQGKAKAFLLVKAQKAEGVELGQIVMMQGRGDGSFSFSTISLMESGYDFGNVCGVGLRFGNQYYAASFWEDEVEEIFLNGKFTIWEKEPIKEEIKAAACEMPQKEIPHEKMIENSRPEKIVEEPKREERPEESQKEEKPQEPEKEEKPQEQKEPEKKSGYVRRIDLNGIRTLPKKNWYLCNNSFLLHGFFNYHYLIVKEKECEGQKRQYLGVPGYYARQERMMAMMFGFPEFEAEEETEPVQEGTLGYWLCPLST